MAEWTAKELRLLSDQWARGTPMGTILRLLPGHTQIAISRQIERLHLRRDPAAIFDNARVGYFDIESNGLKANFHLVLSWFIKERGTNHYDSYTLGHKDFAKKDKTKVDYDCVKHLLEVLPTYDYIVTYYGSMFDIPFIRTRALYHGLTFPPYGSVNHIDCYFAGRGKLCLHSKRLEVVSKFLGIQGKTPLDGGIWVGAGLGDSRSLSYVREHNKQDCIVLEKVHDRLLPFIWNTKRSI